MKRAIGTVTALLVAFAIPFEVFSAGDDAAGGGQTSNSGKAATSAKTDKPLKTVVVKYDADAEIAKIIPLETVPYATVKKICEPMLSKNGSLSYVNGRSAVVVFDKKSVVAKIAKIIKQIDLPAVNIRVDVDFVETGTSKHDRLNVEFYNHKMPRKKNQIVIVNGKVAKVDRINISGVKGSGSSVRNTSQFIMTLSGRPATLWVGRTIIDPTWLNQVKLIPDTLVLLPNGGYVEFPGFDNDFVWRDIGASLRVKPTYLGRGRIDLELYPVVSYLEDDPTDVGRHSKRRPKRKTVRVEEVSTHVVVMNGQRVSIGGAISSKRDFYTNLFGPDFLSRDGHNSLLDMYVTATVVRPGQSGRRSYIPRTPDHTGPIDLPDTSRREDPSRLFRP